MKYQTYLFTGLIIGVLFLGMHVTLAEDIGSITQNQLNTNYPTNLINQDPKTQAEVNAIIDAYINQNFKETYYTEKSSVGEIKLIVKNKYLFTKQKIDFSSVNYHIDKSFKFEGAQYTWKIRKGDQVILEISDINKSNFFYNFPEAGLYQIEVAVNSGGNIKTGSINLDVFDKTSLDYRPLNPGRGDTISVATEIPVDQYIIEWKIDNNIVETNSNTISFPENKGYGQKYIVEAIARDRQTGYTKYYGTAEIEIKKPEIRVSLVNSKNNTPIEFADEINITESTSLIISSNVDNINQSAKLSYSYRINNQIQDGTGNSLTLDVDPNQSYQVDIVAKDTQGDTSVLKSFVINKDKLSLDASLANTVKESNFFSNDRYIGLGILVVAGVIVIVMTKHSKLVRH